MNRHCQSDAGGTRPPDGFSSLGGPRARSEAGFRPAGRPLRIGIDRLATSFRPDAGFTLVELLIGISLSLIVMGAVLSSYVFLSRNFSRTLGISSATQPNLESQSRRALGYFAQDVRMASGIAGSPSASSVTLVLPTGASTTTVNYTYDSIDKNLIRTSPALIGTPQILQTNLLIFSFTYYDNSGNPYTSYTNYLPGIKQVSMSFTAQAGTSANGTLTPVYRSDSSRLILRNKQLLP